LTSDPRSLTTFILASNHSKIELISATAKREAPRTGRGLSTLHKQRIHTSLREYRIIYAMRSWATSQLHEKRAPFHNNEIKILHRTHRMMEGESAVYSQLSSCGISHAFVQRTIRALTSIQPVRSGEAPLLYQHSASGSRPRGLRECQQASIDPRKPCRAFDQYESRGTFVPARATLPRIWWLLTPMRLPVRKTAKGRLGTANRAGLDLTGQGKTVLSDDAGLSRSASRRGTAAPAAWRQPPLQRTFTVNFRTLTTLSISSAPR